MMLYYYRLYRPALFLVAILLLLLLGCGGGGGSALTKPVLIVTDLSWSPAEPQVGEEVTFSAVVRNIGTAPTPAGKTICVTFSMNGSDLCWSDTDQAALAPNTSVTLTATGGPTQKATWTATAGTFQIIAQVDKAQVIQPISTPNNTLEKSLGIQEPPPPPPPPPPPIKIMPLGDSITVGAGSDTSYRYYLWKRLAQAGYDLDFVGSQQGINGHPPLDDDWDEDHEGHIGWRTSDFFGAYPDIGQLGGEQGWAATYQPDIVLILLGTNDLGCGYTPEQAIDHLGAIIDIFRTVNPHVDIILAQIPPVRSDYDNIPGLTAEDRRYLIRVNDSITAYNQQIVLLAQRKWTSLSPVITVDLFSVIDPVRDLPDGVHPNDAANAVLADAWYPAVTALLGNPPRAVRATVPGPAEMYTARHPVKGSGQRHSVGSAAAPDQRSIQRLKIRGR